jgi:hypothetical protein
MPNAGRLSDFLLYKKMPQAHFRYGGISYKKSRRSGSPFRYLATAILHSVI